MDLIYNKSSLVQVLTWRLIGVKLLTGVNEDAYMRHRASTC